MKDKLVKICFVSPFAYGLFNPGDSLKFGGAEVQMYLIAKELSQDEDFETNFIVLDRGQKSQETHNRVKVYGAYKQGREIGNLLVAPFKLLATLNKINPDVVICRAGGVEVGISALWAKFAGKKFIYSIAHDKDVDGSYFKGFRGKIFQFGFLTADKLIAQNEIQANDLREKYKGKEKNIEVIKNSLEIKERAEEEKEIIFWIGSSADLKRPQIFLDLASCFPEEKFIMVMTKSKINLSLWDDIYNKSKEISNLELIEKVPFAKIEDYFAKTKVFVSTSQGEGSPNTFFQTANNRAPILSLKVDPDNFISKYNCGLVCNDNYDKLKENLEKILASSQMREEMGQNAYQYVKREHNIKENIKIWKNIFKNL